MAKPKLLVINQYYWPDLAATGQLLAELTEGLAKDFAVTVISSTPSYSVTEAVPRRLFRWQDSERSGVRIIRIWSPGLPRYKLWGRIVNIVAYGVGALVAALFAPRSDYVMVWTDPPFVGVIGALVRIIKGSRLLFVCQDFYPEVAMSMGRLPKVAIWIMRGLRQFIVEFSDQVVAISPAMRQRFIDLGVSKMRVKVIPNWIDSENLPLVSKENEFRQSHQLTGKFVIMHSGNIGFSQDFSTLLEAAARIDDPEVMWVFVGDGARRGWLEAQIRERQLRSVRVLPYQPRSQLHLSLGAADIHLVTLLPGLNGLIVPSKIYGIMGAARPVVGVFPEKSEVADFIEKNEIGWVVSPADAKNLAATLQRLKAAPEQLAQRGEKGRKVVCHSFTKHVIVRQYKNLILGV